MLNLKKGIIMTIPILVILAILPFVNPAGGVVVEEAKYCDTGIYPCEGILMLWEFGLIPAGVSPVTLPSENSNIVIMPSDVPCTDKLAVTIGYFDINTYEWVPIGGKTVDTNPTTGGIEVTVPIPTTLNDGQPKSLAIMEDPDECRRDNCGAGGGFLLLSDPARLNKPVWFLVCNATPNCNPTEAGCDENCPMGVDPDCGHTSCTKNDDDCCYPYREGTTDPDCATFTVKAGQVVTVQRGTDSEANPCIIESGQDYECCTSGVDIFGYGCDSNCGAYGSCSGCTASAGDCCDPGKMNPDPSSPGYVYSHPQKDTDCNDRVAGPCDSNDGQGQPNCLAGYDLDNEYPSNPI